MNPCDSREYKVLAKNLVLDCIARLSVLEFLVYHSTGKLLEYHLRLCLLWVYHPEVLLKPLENPCYGVGLKSTVLSTTSSAWYSNNFGVLWYTKNSKTGYTVSIKRQGSHCICKCLSCFSFSLY